METAFTFWFVKGSQISGVQMASTVIVLFEVVTFNGTVSTFLHLELLFPKVLINKRSLLNVGKFNSFLNFSTYNSAGSHYQVIKECFFVTSNLNLKQQPRQFAKNYCIFIVWKISYGLLGIILAFCFR